MHGDKRTKKEKARTCTVTSGQKKKKPVRQHMRRKAQTRLKRLFWKKSRKGQLRQATRLEIIQDGYTAMTKR